VADLFSGHIGLTVSLGAVQVPRESRAALQQMQDIACFGMLPTSIVLYIDGGGANAESTAAWALAAFYRYACGAWIFRGYLTGLVQVDPSHPQHLGVTSATGGAAELCA
jgi:hypothetical protein